MSWTDWIGKLTEGLSFSKHWESLENWGTHFTLLYKGLFGSGNADNHAVKINPFWQLITNPDLKSHITSMNPRIKHSQYPSETEYIFLSYGQIQRSKAQLITSICRKKQATSHPSSLLTPISSIICRYLSGGGMCQLPTITSYVNVIQRGFGSLPNHTWLLAKSTETIISLLITKRYINK